MGDAQPHVRLRVGRARDLVEPVVAQVRVVDAAGAAPADLRLAVIDPGTPARTVSQRAALDTAGRTSTGPAQRGGVTPEPQIFSRAQWGADESMRDKGSLRYYEVHAGFVHHTVNANDYSRDEVPGILRSIYAYHTKSRGWSDVGYNFLVDRFGRTWVGRAGGPSRPIRGAHTLGFNHTSVGVAVIGNYESAAAVDRIVTAIVRLAAWKLDRYDRKPRGRTRVYSHGSDKYPKGWVRLKVIDGHRDTNDTACPGDRLYARLPEIRKRTHWHVKRWS